MENYDQLIEKLIPRIMAGIRAKSKPVESLNVKDNMNGIVSMPCYDTTGGIFKAVLVPLDVLRKPALDASEAAMEVVEVVENLVDEANGILNLVESNETSRMGNEINRESNEAIRLNNEEVRLSLFEKMQQSNANAVEYALEVASHPTYVGEDNYVYQWDSASKSFNKTNVYVRGESFSISKVYSSIEEMNNDTQTLFKEGDFCLINTNDVENADNAKLYVKDSNNIWQFLVDMSGAIGFTGKTPQIFVGEVSVGESQDSISITLESDGVDMDGNPKFKFNFVMPCLSYEDLTSEQVQELQKPANDMIQQLEMTNVESIRLAEEIKTHQPRINDEGFWEVWDITSKVYVNTNVIARGRQPIIQEGVWYLWNDYTGKYESTGYYSSGADCPVVNERPTSSTTTYIDNGIDIPFYIGQLCRYNNGEEWEIFILKNISDNGAVWVKWYEDIYESRIKDLEETIKNKQDTINDLESIRENALFNNGANKGTDISSIPIDKRLYVASISSSDALSLSSIPEAGREIHVIIHNASDNTQSIALPNTGNYICMVDSALSIDSGAYAELNIISDGDKMYIRGL